MQPRLTVRVLGDFSAPRIVDIGPKERRTWKGKVKLKKLDLSECEEKLEDRDASSPIKHLIAKKFASIVPKRNVKVPQIVTKLKVIKLLRKSNRPKSLSSYRHANVEQISLDTKCRINSREKTTLEMLIPPSENFQGFNNPFSSRFKGTCSIKSNKPVPSDYKVNDENNNWKDKSKKVCVKGRMKMENASMKYLAESQLPFFEESSSFNICNKVQRNIDIIDEDVLVKYDDSVTDVDMLENNDDEKLVERSNQIQEQMNTQAECQLLCDHCPAMFNSHESFEKHVKSNCAESPEKVNLDESPTLMKSINDSEKHEENPLGEKLSKQFLCDNCPTFFNSVDSLEMHMENHTEDRLMTQSLCDQCPTLWYSRENLKLHCDRMHTPNSRENLKSHCDRMYMPNSRKNLKSHCDRMYTQNSRENLKSHFDKVYLPNSSHRHNIRTLEEGKTLEDGTPGEETEKVSYGEKDLRCDKFARFLCNICQRCFYDKRGLTLHKLVHSRKKSYRKSSRILAKKLDSGENNKRILYSKTSTYRYQKDISEYYNKNEELICAKSSKKYRKRVTTWRGKEKKNESAISVRKCKKTRMDVKMENTNFLKNNRKSSRRTSELNERSTPRARESKVLRNKSIDLERNKNRHHGIEKCKNDNPDECLGIMELKNVKMTIQMSASKLR